MGKGVDDGGAEDNDDEDDDDDDDDDDDASSSSSSFTFEDLSKQQNAFYQPFPMITFPSFNDHPTTSFHWKLHCVVSFF